MKRTNILIVLNANALSDNDTSTEGETLYDVFLF